MQKEGGLCLNRKRGKMKVLYIILLCILLCSGILYFYNRLRFGTKDAISILKAYFMKDNVEYFIVGVYKNYGNGGYYYTDGNEKIPVDLLGSSPECELSWYISGGDAGNLFLIKGSREENMSDFIGKETIFVESWDIIAPIKRTYEIEDPNMRIFAPRQYLDQYDVDSGGYYEVYKGIRALSYNERIYFESRSEHPCYIITSEYIEENLQWYILKDEMLIPIMLDGANPENNLNEVILSRKSNIFLVSGLLDELNLELYIEEWFILYPITRIGKKSHLFYESRYYFEQYDIEVGTFIP